MFDLLLKLGGSRWWYPCIAAILALICLSLILAVGMCGRNEQAEQTAKSGAATSQAGSAAIEIVASTAAGEAAQDRETVNTVGVIHESTDPDAVRRAVIDRVCRQEAHRLDPACRVR